jgi:AcrR family transcriptional regulator
VRGESSALGASTVHPGVGEGVKSSALDARAVLARVACWRHVGREGRPRAGPLGGRRRHQGHGGAAPRALGRGGLSLRAVARDLGLVSSALYRYFPSRDALLTALIVDAYDAVGAVAEQGRRGRRCCGRRSGHALARGLPSRPPVGPRRATRVRARVRHPRARLQRPPATPLPRRCASAASWRSWWWRRPRTAACACRPVRCPHRGSSPTPWRTSPAACRRRRTTTCSSAPSSS